MKITLNIDSDTELRSAIKSIVDGQVRSIVREEIAKVIIDEVKKKILNLSDVNSIIKDSVTKYVHHWMENEKGMGKYYSNVFNNMVSEKLDQKIKSLSKPEQYLSEEKILTLINNVAKEKINKLLDI